MNVTFLCETMTSLSFIISIFRQSFFSCIYFLCVWYAKKKTQEETRHYARYHLIIYSTKRRRLFYKTYSMKRSQIRAKKSILNLCLICKCNAVPKTIDLPLLYSYSTLQFSLCYVYIYTRATIASTPKPRLLFSDSVGRDDHCPDLCNCHLGLLLLLLLLLLFFNRF